MSIYKTKVYVSRPLPKHNNNMSRIRIKAGKKIYQIIKDGGFNFDSVSTYFGPAVGPRWLDCQRI